MHYNKSLALVIALLLILLVGTSLFFVIQRLQPQSESGVVKESIEPSQQDTPLEDQVVEIVPVENVVPEYKTYSKDELNTYIESLGPENEALKVFLQEEINKYDQ